MVEILIKLAFLPCENRYTDYTDGHGLRKNLCESVKSVVKIFIPLGEHPAHGELL
jgi:hypothetical protein